MNREAIWTALEGLFTASEAFVTVSRRLKLWSDVDPSQKPAIFIVDHGETVVQGSEATPSKVTINAELFIYTAVKDQNAVPATVLNNLLDAVDTAIAPSPAWLPKQTLGGLVAHCWVEGKILKEPGDLDGDGLAIVPVKILVPC